MAVCTVALIVSICPLGAEEPPLKGPNLITDGTFETRDPGPVDPGDLPDGWSAEAYGRSGQLSIVADSAPGCGHQCVQMRSQRDDSTGLHSVLIEIHPHKAYLQCGWIKVVRGEHGSGLHLGRAWYTADESPASSKHSGKNYKYIVTHADDREWTCYRQVLLPDQTPEDGQYESHEIPSEARFVRIWALAYRWDGTGRFDGLGLYEIDYDRWARQKIQSTLKDTDVGAAVGDIQRDLRKVSADEKIAQEAKALLSEFSTLQDTLNSGKSRPVNDWIADEQRLATLIEVLEQTRWRLKLTALLQASPPPDE
ncbi:MAG: hypothetical protein ACLFWB_13860 [Armatimonadota bacterium]